MKVPWVLLMSEGSDKSWMTAKGPAEGFGWRFGVDSEPC